MFTFGFLKVAADYSQQKSFGIGFGRREPMSEVEKERTRLSKSIGKRQVREEVRLKGHPESVAAGALLGGLLGGVPTAVKGNNSGGKIALTAGIGALAGGGLGFWGAHRGAQLNRAKMKAEQAQHSELSEHINKHLDKKRAIIVVPPKTFK